MKKSFGPFLELQEPTVYHSIALTRQRRGIRFVRGHRRAPVVRLRQSQLPQCAAHGGNTLNISHPDVRQLYAYHDTAFMSILQPSPSEDITREFWDVSWTPQYEK